jgi:pilus assembly protein Flp/PilA
MSGGIAAASAVGLALPLPGGWLLGDGTEPEEVPPMKRFQLTLVSFLRDEDGPTAVEYAVMLALIIVVCITAVTTLGSNANNTFSYVGTKVGKTGSS